MNTSKIIAGFVAGAAIGGVLGILFAPDKGEETRKRLAQKGGEVSDSLKEKFSDFVDTMKDNFGSAKQEVEDVAEKGISSFNKFKTDTGSAVL